MRPQSELLQIVKAVSLLRLAFRFGQRGQQHGREDGDDGDDDQKFDESESGGVPSDG